MKFGKVLLIFIYIMICLAVSATGICYYTVRKDYKTEYREMIEKYALDYSLDPCLVLAVIKTESNFKCDAVSSAGAVGLMQLLPSTAEWIAGKIALPDFDASKLKDPDMNIRMGCWYLNYLKNKFENDGITEDEKMTLVFAAYNAGPGKVSSWLENEEYSWDGKTLEFIPYRETSDYIKKVMTGYKIYGIFYQK